MQVRACPAVRDGTVYLLYGRTAGIWGYVDSRDVCGGHRVVERAGREGAWYLWRCWIGPIPSSGADSPCRRDRDLPYGQYGRPASTYHVPRLRPRIPRARALPGVEHDLPGLALDRPGQARGAGLAGWGCGRVLLLPALDLPGPGRGALPTLAAACLGRAARLDMRPAITALQLAVRHGGGDGGEEEGDDVERADARQRLGQRGAVEEIEAHERREERDSHGARGD